MAHAKHQKTPADYGPGTPLNDAIERIAHRWTVLIVIALEQGPVRFTELKETIRVSPQVLTRNLRALERDGFIERQVLPEVPVRVEYSLTPFGGTMCPIVASIREWAEKSAPAISAARTTYDHANEADRP